MSETKKRLASNENNSSKEIEDEYEEYENKSNRRKRKSNEKFEKLSPRNNALKFTLYGERKGIINTDAYLPTISQSQQNNTEITDHNTFGSKKYKGVIDYKRNLGRIKEVNRININPSSYDYNPNYENMNKYAGTDKDYKKKKFKLMKLMKNYHECSSEYQIVKF